jgi:hypothetical protein
MLASLRSLTTLYVFSPARIAHALDAVAQQLAQRGDPALERLARHVDDTLAHTRELGLLELRFASSQAQGRGRPDIMRVRVKLERALVGFRNAARATAAALDGDGTDHAVQARELLHECFPRGVQALRRCHLPDLLTAVDVIVAKAEEKHGSTIDMLGLRSLFDRILRLNRECWEVALEHRPPTVPFENVRRARELAQERLLQIVAMILGSFPLSTPEDIAARTALMHPILFHNEAIGAAIRRRRRDRARARKRAREDDAAAAASP